LEVNNIEIYFSLLLLTLNVPGLVTPDFDHNICIAHVNIAGAAIAQGRDAVALLGHECSPQPLRQEANFRPLSTAVIQTIQEKRSGYVAYSK